MDQVTGGCLCGAVRIVATGQPLRVGICHCLDCRKHHGALFYAAAIFPAAAVSVTGETHAFRGRHFCPDCGSSIFARTGAEVEVHLGTLDADHETDGKVGDTARAGGSIHHVGVTEVVARPERIRAGPPDAVRRPGPRHRSLIGRFPAAWGHPAQETRLRPDRVLCNLASRPPQEARV